MKAAGALDALQLRVVLTGDEELTGEPLPAAREALVSEAKRADIAIGFENGPGDPRTAVIARRGTTGWLLRVKAKPAHSSQIFREDIGSGAIYEAARVLSAFRETLGGEAHLTFNPGVILGGTAVDLDVALARGTRVGQGKRHRRAGDRDGRPAGAVGGAVRQRARRGCARSSRSPCRTPSPR